MKSLRENLETEKELRVKLEKVGLRLTKNLFLSCNNDQSILALKE